MRAKEFLTELIDNPFPYYGDPNNHKFTGNERPGLVKFSEYFFTTDDKIPYQVTIEKVDNITSLKYRGPMGTIRPQSNSVRDKFRILSTVASIAKSYFENPHARTKIFQFSGSNSDIKRLTFYESISKNIEKYLPWYKFDYQESNTEHNYTKFVFRLKDDVKLNEIGGADAPTYEIEPYPGRVPKNDLWYVFEDELGSKYEVHIATVGSGDSTKIYIGLMVEKERVTSTGKVKWLSVSPTKNKPMAVSMRVWNTVKKILQEAIEKLKPVEIYFGSPDPKLSKFYGSIINRFIKWFPDYTYSPKSDAYNHIFVRTNI
jgi:hypothetical protein